MTGDRSLGVALVVLSLGCGGSPPREVPSDDTGPRAASVVKESATKSTATASAAALSTGAPSGSGSARSRGVVGAEAVAAFDTMSDFDKSRVKHARIFFGHQSVGANILDGARSLGFPSRPITGTHDFDAPALGEAPLLENHEPLRKVKSFDAFVSTFGDRVDAVGMKLCWVDFYEPEKLVGLREAYAAEVDSLRKRYPKVAVFHVTPPLATKEPVENGDRVAFGRWLISTYAQKDVVFDLEAVESMSSAGMPCVSRGVPALCTEYAADDGHLNAVGAQRAAKAFIVALGRAVTPR
ncbi:MAG TPA: hypothetical protein VL400_23835 [Polyangiaceae bacterium]|nr:hypothetical protein [Polyangiaceae bacterium]